MPAHFLARGVLPVNFLSSVLAVVLIVTAAPAHAQVVDLAATKCQEFLALKPDRIGFILMWLDGY